MNSSVRLFIERKDENGNWVLVPETEEPRKERWSTSQRFDFLAMLGGVESPDIPPMCESKGLPDNMSAELQEILAQDIEKNGESHLLLSEIMALGDKTFSVSGYLGLEEYQKWLDSGKKKVEKAYKSVPRSCTIITNQRMNRVIHMAGFMEENTYFTLMTWDELYSETDKYFWNQMVPKFKEIDSNPDNVRMVFWFVE